MSVKLPAMMERKKSLLSEAREDLRTQIFQAIRELDERISKEEMALLENKQNVQEILKERRNAKVEEGRELLLRVVSLECR